MTELTAEAEERERVRAADAAVADPPGSAASPAPAEEATPAMNGPGRKAERRADRDEPADPSTHALTFPASDARVANAPPAPVGESTRLAAGRERVAALRERLAVAARPPAAGAEPKRTAAAVLEVVQDLRARLQTAIQERSAVTDTLEETRSMLARAQADLEKERKLRTVIEERGEERARIADEAVAEAEALAAERDQVLAELTEQRSLDDEQAELLAEAEAVLARRDAERAEAAEEIGELRDQLEARSVEIADLESRLQSSAADYGRLEVRCREIEAEVDQLTEAKEALESIEATVNRRS